MRETEDIKRAVRERYAGHAGQGTSCCGNTAAASSSCCGGTAATEPAGCGCGSASASATLGYDPADLAGLPEGADLGLGCGNPLALLGLREGQTVLDLGSGAGIDCFLAANRVGPGGRVIGVDMTPEMVERARRNADAAGISNVEFRLGELENLPVADGTVDAVVSNCVINLVPDKARAFSEAFRALRPGGTLSVSDIVLTGEIPVAVRDSAEAYVACLSGAVMRDEYLRLIAEAGFSDVEVTAETAFVDPEELLTRDAIEEFARHADATYDEMRDAAGRFVSLRVQAKKPA